jgi:hypothetical protein
LRLRLWQRRKEGEEEERPQHLNPTQQPQQQHQHIQQQQQQQQQMNLPFKHPRPNKPKDIFRKEIIEALGISAISEREASEMSRHGEVLRWSSESEEDTQLQSTKHRKD